LGDGQIAGGGDVDVAGKGFAASHRSACDVGDAMQEKRASFLKKYVAGVVHVSGVAEFDGDVD